MNILTNLSVQRTENAEKVMDLGFPSTFVVDSQHCLDTEFPAGLTDEELTLYESSLVVASSYIIIVTDKPIQIKLDLNTNTPIDVNSIMFLTNPALILFLTVPGTENARVKIYYGGTQT